MSTSTHAIERPSAPCGTPETCLVLRFDFQRNKEQLADDAFIEPFAEAFLDGTVDGYGAHSIATMPTRLAFYSLKGQAGRPLTRTQRSVEEAATSVGSNVWIGARATVVDGVSVGDGAIVGTGAVVVNPVPAYAIVGGVPARLIRMRLEEDVVRALERFQWWAYIDPRFVMRDSVLRARVNLTSVFEAQRVGVPPAGRNEGC